MYEDRGYDWISLYSDHSVNVVDVKYEKRHLRYDTEKRALIVPAERVTLDYGDDDEADKKVERPNAIYLAFVKCGEKKLHYMV